MPAPATSPPAVVGLIEGFYGRPWTWGERLEVLQACADLGMTHYVYAPKDDTRHRAQWREPYDQADVAGFRRLVDRSGLTVGFGISPGLSIDVTAPGDLVALWGKVAQALDAGIRLVCLALDDIPNRLGLGREHADLTAWLHDRLAGEAQLLLVPTEYVGVRRTPYVEALDASVPADVLIAWTGMAVVNDAVTAGEARRRAEALGGRAPLLWDNYPVNDAVMADRLFLGPLRGREAGLRAALGGYLANAMVQPRANLLPLASTAAWLRGDDPETAWSRAADELGWRPLAEACDGTVPARLVAAVTAGDEPGAAGALRAWLQAAAACEAPGLDAEAGPWIEQTRAECRLALVALDLVEATRRGEATGDRAALAALHLADRWPAVRRSATTVLGPRCSFRPVLGQGVDGEWIYRAASLQEDANALDHLVRFALAGLARAGDAGA